MISGLSGSGKSIALRALEDLGYYCIDNLPIVMLKDFADILVASQSESLWRAAVSIDSRNQHFLGSLVKNLKYLQKCEIEYEFIFLSAEEPVLVKRFSETGRKHPLMIGSLQLAEAIQLEQQILAPLSERATKHFDTTSMTPHELRSLIQEDTYKKQTGSTESPSLLFKSFAYKRGAPLDADFVFDVRCLPNPYWEPHLKDYNGLDAEIVEYFSEKPEVREMIDQISLFLDPWLKPFLRAGRIYVTVAIGCTGGRHRSVYVVERLVQQFASRNVSVHKRHSELA